ncbi:MAG: hypothetical protein HY273_06020 [Gammaproteobacteria bacterium]|nr:hypothetical protein [Gammaproteobacteria bacterium]
MNMPRANTPLQRSSAFYRGLRLSMLAFWTAALAGVAQAGTLGLPDNTARIGYSAGPAYISIDAARSAPNKTWSAVQSLIYTDWFLAGTRYWAALRYQQADFDAGVNKTGAHLTSYGARLSVQNSFRVTESFSPWLGFGLDITQNNYSKQFRVDSDGYLAERFAARSTLSSGVVLNAATEWSFGRAMHAGMQLEQLLSVNDKLRETTLWASLLYRY